MDQPDRRTPAGTPRDVVPYHPWNALGLRGDPFFAEPLEPFESGDRPLSRLFVGRGAEIDGALRSISINTSSRQLVGGAPGVGRTTFVQQLKAKAAAAGILSCAAPVEVRPEETGDQILWRILVYLFDAVLGAGPSAPEHPAVRDARRYLRAVLLPRLGQSDLPAYVTPEDHIRSLVGFAGEEAAGVLLHLELPDGMAEAERTRMRTLIRDLRDPALHIPDLHVVLVGEMRSVSEAVGTPQVGSIVGRRTELEPLQAQEVEAVLSNRLEWLRADRAGPAAELFSAGALRAAWEHADGSLPRLFEFLRALAERVRPLVSPGDLPIDEPLVRSLLPAPSGERQSDA